MINDGFPYEELKELTIDELLEIKNTVKKTRQREALQDKKEKKSNQLDNIKTLFTNNENYKLIELCEFFINDDHECIFKNIDKVISKIDFREQHHLQASIYKKYHNNQYKEPKTNKLLLELLTKEKEKNKKIIQKFINKYYIEINNIILDYLKNKEIILNKDDTLEKINTILSLLDTIYIEQYIDNCTKIYKINEYKKYLQLIRTQ
jgi:hypothetical protein